MTDKERDQAIEETLRRVKHIENDMRQVIAALQRIERDLP